MESEKLTGWQPIETPPTEPCNVLLLCPPFEWRDMYGNAVPPDPMRDLLERFELAWWTGEMWCESGTGHEISAHERPEHLLPTHWQPLPAPPGTTRAPADLRSALEAGAIERCAKVADVYAEPADTPSEFTEAFELAARKIARRIRKLAPTKGDVS